MVWEEGRLVNFLPSSPHWKFRSHHLKAELMSSDTDDIITIKRPNLSSKEGEEFHWQTVMFPSLSHFNNDCQMLRKKKQLFVKYVKIPISLLMYAQTKQDLLDSCSPPPFCKARNTQKTSKWNTKKYLRVSWSCFYQFNDMHLATARETSYFSSIPSTLSTEYWAKGRSSVQFTPTHLIFSVNKDF